MEQPETIRPERLKTKIFSTIRDVPRQEWNNLVNGHSCALSYEFWDVIEHAKLNDFDYRHVIFYDDAGTPVALTTCYSITTDIAIFATGGLKWILNGIRRLFPNFLKLRMLECGTPITPNTLPFISDGKIPPKDIVESLNDLLMTKAKAEGQFLIVIRDFEPEAEPLRPDFERLGYHWVDSLPNTYMDIRWASPEDYLSSMKSYYRSKLLKHLSRSKEQQIGHVLIDDFQDLAETLQAQWQVVHDHAGEYQREVLTAAFYREFSSLMGARSRVILFYQQDRLIGHALLLMDGDMLRWLFFGRTEAANDSLYIYAGHKVVETAILSGAKRLELGLTSYPIKQDLGAQTIPVKFALRSPYRLVNPVIGLFYPLLNDTPDIHNRAIFKKGPGSDSD